MECFLFGYGRGDGGGGRLDEVEVTKTKVCDVGFSVSVFPLFVETVRQKE